ncbi:MAG: fatty acid CoA ligase family protein [Planctomycetaceae bacterium]|nr:fatty acid CoA ligase family protein [Planctomycetaceae bacterium]
MNIAHRLVDYAKRQPNAVAIIEPVPKSSPADKRKYRTISFAELDRDSDRIAAAYVRSGLQPGMRIALMVQQGLDFISLVFGLLKSGATLVLIDPGMGMKPMLKCLDEVRLDGFAAISKVHALRFVLQRLGRFSHAKQNLTVGRRWFWCGLSLAEIRKREYFGPVMIPRDSGDPSAIIFTSGSTGIAKGVLFTHGIFQTQVEEIQRRLGIEPGSVDLAGFPFFGLFNAAMGVTAVIPDMDSTRPASVDPRNILEAVRDWNINQSFGSPALWNRVVEFCERNPDETGSLSTLRRVISAGAPISAKLLDRLKRILHVDAEIFTPYGATEALPVAMISATEILGETVRKTETGGGICVGTSFGTVRWKTIAISDEPIERLEQARECGVGEIGELAVCGPQVTTQYVTRTEANAFAKMRDADGTIWHRMGDVGYLDEKGRFWFCGRKAHRVETADGTLFSIPCEAIFNQHPKVFRSALVGISVAKLKEPAIFIELKPGVEPSDELLQELKSLAKANPLTQRIERIRFHPGFPVDVRHNAKINREQLAEEGRERKF